MKNQFRRVPFGTMEQSPLSFLCLCCITGIVLGYLADHAVSLSDHEALRTYLRQYASYVSQQSTSLSLAASAGMTYLRAPLLLCILGCTTYGLFLSPVVCFAESFFLSFAVSGFVSALGRSGIWLAFSAFGIRCLIVLPCLFILAQWAMASSRELRQHRGRRKKRTLGPDLYMRVAACLTVPLLGIAAELFIVPQLLQLSLKHLI